MLVLGERDMSLLLILVIPSSSLEEADTMVIGQAIMATAALAD